MINLWDFSVAGSTDSAALQSGETLPAAFFGSVARRAEAVFLRSKSLGVWASTSWGEAGTIVREAAQGLRKLGVGKGDVVCTIAHTRQECVFADLAIMSVGAVSAAISPGLTGDMTSLCRRIGAKVVLVGDEEQLHRLRDTGGELPGDLVMLMFDAPVLADRDDGAAKHILRWDSLLESGRSAPSNDQDDWSQLVGTICPDSPAILSCSAGTTGQPECVSHSHRAVLEACRALHQRVGYSAADSKLCFLSWARANERILSVYLPILGGTRLNFTEGLDTVPENLREVAPSLVSATPRHLRKLRDEVLAAVAEAGPMPRAAFDWAMARGAQVATSVIRGEQVSFGLRVSSTVARLLILNNVRRFMGLDGCRHLFAVDGMLPSAIAEWYLALGIPVVQLWGNTQTLGVAAINALPNFRLGTVGKPIANCRVEIDGETGELSVSGPTVSGDGTVRTGDTGRFDAKGYLEVTGRTCESMATTTGEQIPASRIRQMLRDSPYVQDALVFGEGRPFASALILLAREKVEHHAHRIGISFPDFSCLTRAAEIRELLQSTVDETNARLQASHRISHFHLIEHDIDLGDEEMTPTRELRRWAIESRYRRQIESMYA